MDEPTLAPFKTQASSASSSSGRLLPPQLSVEANLELIIGLYRQEETSQWVLKALERLQREHALLLVSTAVLIKNSRGRLLTRQIVDGHLEEGGLGLMDGVAAALVSLFNPVGELGVSPFKSGGLAVEVLVENLAELGVTYEELSIFSKGMVPQSSVLIALTKRPWVRRLMVEMAHTDARLIHKPMVPALRTHFGEHFINLAEAVILENAQAKTRFSAE